MSSDLALNRQEWRAAAALALVFFLRMLGLFMLIPVLALYAESLAGATPFLIGLAIGIYGLTQTVFQIPLGMLSDRVGRRPVIVVGLIIFGVGGLLAAAAQSIWPIVIGRAVQGAGAVSGSTLALAADLSRDSQRTKVMAIIGISIGVAFSVAFVVGPVLNAHFGLRGVFLCSALLAFLAIVVVVLLVPNPPAAAAAAAPARIWPTLAAPDLRVLYLGVFTLHLVLAASFVAIPIALVNGLGVPAAEHYAVYLPVLLASIVIVGPFIGLSARPGLGRTFFYAAIAGMAMAEFGLWLFWQDRFPLYCALTLFFVAFNFMESALPGIISRAAPAASKGTALGAYASFQFIGMFCGGILGGGTAGRFDFDSVPLVCASLCAVWLGLSLKIPGAVLSRPAKD